MIFLMVLDRSSYRTDWYGLLVLMVLCWSLNCRKCSVDLSLTGVFLVASGEIFSFPCIFESITLLFHHHSTMTTSDNDLVSY